MAIESRWAEGNYDLLPALAADLIGHKVDVIATSGGDRSAVAAKTATSVIPIVSVIGGEPVAAGLITSLARPGGNLTGVSFLTAELMPKRLELLSEVAPDAKVIVLLVNPENPQTEGVIKDMEQPRTSRVCSFRSSRPAQKPRSTRLLLPSPSRKPARSPSRRTRSSTPGASSL